MISKEDLDSAVPTEGATFALGVLTFMDGQVSRKEALVRAIIAYQAWVMTKSHREQMLIAQATAKVLKSIRHHGGDR